MPSSAVVKFLNIFEARRMGARCIIISLELALCFNYLVVVVSSFSKNGASLNALVVVKGSDVS